MMAGANSAPMMAPRICVMAATPATGAAHSARLQTISAREAPASNPRLRREASTQAPIGAVASMPASPAAVIR